MFELKKYHETQSITKLKKESKIKIAHKYAKALYEGSGDDGALKAVMGDMSKLQDLLKAEVEIVKYLANPLWSVESKKEVISEIAIRLKLAQETLNCLYVIADNNRFLELGNILSGFKSIYYEKHGIVEVMVETVKTLSKLQEDKLKDNLKKLLKKDVLVNYEVKPEILGGLIISYDSDMIDDSIKGKLNRLETVMKGGL